MAFVKKTWKNRIAEYINRRLLTKEDGSTELVTVARDEGTISQEGDAFNAANMNDLEDRIEAGFNEVNQSLTDNNIIVNLPQSKFTWSESYVWRIPYIIPTGYALECINVYATNGDATLSGAYRFINDKMHICITGTYLDSTTWTIKPITNSYNFICNLKLRKA